MSKKDENESPIELKPATKDGVPGMTVVNKGEPKKLTKAQQKKAEREAKEEEKRQAKAQKEAMEKQIEGVHKMVQKSICKTCVNCISREMKKDRLKITSSAGDEFYLPMNFCKIAGISLAVDVSKCDEYKKAE